jgi:hypothetical protein
MIFFFLTLCNKKKVTGDITGRRPSSSTTTQFSKPCGPAGNISEREFYERSQHLQLTDEQLCENGCKFLRYFFLISNLFLLFCVIVYTFFPI